MWTLAELHRLAMDLALTTTHARLDDGMTLDTTISTNQDNHYVLPFRVALTVLHSLWPVLYDSLQTATHRRSRGQYQAYWELHLERVRFACRVLLILPHWWRVYQQQQRQQQDHSTLPLVPPGILQYSGLLPSAPRPTLAQEKQRLERLVYVGKRTGRNVLQKDNNLAYTNHDSSLSQLGRHLRILVGEWLHTLRPLFWAQCKYRHYCRSSTTQGDNQSQQNYNRLWEAWLVSLGMDVASLICLAPDNTDNPATAREWKHRRLRLLLYCLRTPCTDRFADPFFDRIHKWMTESSPLPWLGNLLAAYLQDWLFYWRVYHLEE